MLLSPFIASLSRTLIVIPELDELLAFLRCRTPDAWVASALDPDNLSLLLVDHAQCEKKAASSAMNMMYRYVDRHDLLKKMSKLAREELVHFDQVISLMRTRDIEYTHLTASRYAAGLNQHVRNHEPDKLVDRLIVGAFVEARSCERFACIAPHLDAELSKFYTSLLKSEARHFKDYLHLARVYADKPIEDRIAHFAEVEQDLIESEDTEFRFHSGPIAAA